MPTNSTTVSLVLGSGGARGLAHIGVIRWLLENGYEIRSIAGSSMGALVGGIHAYQKLEVYAQWVSALERAHVLRLVDPTLGRDGLIKGDRIIGVLREMIGDCHIEDLPLAYTAVATDLETGEEVWLREGRLFDAIRASMATPLVFTPFRHGERHLLDGALVNPLPVAATVDDRTDLTIAVNLNGPPEPRTRQRPEAAPAEDSGGRRRIGPLIGKLRRGQPGGEPGEKSRRGLLDVAFLSMQTMHDTITKLKLTAHAPDVTIAIPRDACGFHEFWRAQEMIDLGRERAERVLGARAEERPPLSPPAAC